MPNTSKYDTYYTPVVYITCLFAAIFLRYIMKTFMTKSPAATIAPPPSPPALPFIGHLHIIGSVLPKSFQSLAKRYGPLMLLRLGASECVVVSSEAVAKEIFKTHELNFSSRPEFGSSEYFIYRGSRFVMAQYGDYWRFMKKLCMTRLLSVPQLEKFTDIREQEMEKMMESVSRTCKEGKPCRLSNELTTVTNNIICRMAMSSRCSGMDDEATQVHKIVSCCLELAGKLSAGDILGPLKVFDFSGNGKKLVSALQRFDQIVERIIDEHEGKAYEGDRRKDLLDILLEIYHDSTAEIKLSRNDIKSFLLDIFMAGTDTSSTAMQWTMAELINCPQAFNRLKEEIHTVVGTNRLVKESDIPNLPYLRAVIRETLRLHPSAPLIIRECAQDCTVNDFHVKAKTRVLVNVYAIMRNPNSWEKADVFMPERFLEDSGERIGEHQMEFKGQNFRYLPFGSGRRGCPGASLAMLVMHVAVAVLVQFFDWNVKDSEKVDLSLGSGFAAEMATPLVCYPTKHFN